MSNYKRFAWLLLVLQCAASTVCTTDMKETDAFNDGPADVGELVNDVGNLRRQMEIDMRSIKEELAALRNIVRTKVTGQVAFSVHREATFGPVTVTTKVPFPEEDVNIGGDWLPHIDAFQASIAGYYVLSASAASLSGTAPAVRIIHTNTGGDHILASLVASGDIYNGDEHSVIVYLEVGDFVSVQLSSTREGVIYSNSNKYTSFSGFLLTL